MKVDSDLIDKMADGLQLVCSVYDKLDAYEKKRTSMENVMDVLRALHRLKEANHEPR